MAAVYPTAIVHEGQSTIRVGTNWVHCKLLRCTFDGVDPSAPDAWDMRTDVGGTNTSTNAPIAVAASVGPAATGEDANVVITKTAEVPAVTDDNGAQAAGITTPAYTSITFSGAENDYDGDVMVWVVG